MKNKKALTGWDFVVTAIIVLIAIIIIGVIIYMVSGESSNVIDQIKNII